MSDQESNPAPDPLSAPTPASGPPVVTAPPLPPAAQKKTLAILSLVFGGVAFLFGVIPSTAGAAWAFAIVAIILAIIAMVKKVPPRWMPPVGLGLAVLGWLIGIIVVVSGVATSLSSLSTGNSEGGGSSTGVSASPTGPASESAEAKPAKNSEAAIGETITNNKKVSFTVNSVTCGLTTVGPQYFEQTAKGQFCEIKYTVANGSDDKISLYASDLTGLIGKATYDVDDGTISTFNGDYFSTDVNPGLSADADVFIDIPAGAALNYLVYKPQFSLFTSEVKVKVS